MDFVGGKEKESFLYFLWRNLRLCVRVKKFSEEFNAFLSWYVKGEVEREGGAKEENTLYIYQKKFNSILH